MNAPKTYAVMGRGTGKTSGILAPKVRECCKLMPRATGAMVGATYNQVLTRTLPSLVSGLERLGLVKDFHYFVGRRPPKKLNWPEPYEPPLSYEHFIPFWNGYGIHIISQDRKGSSNGLNVDHIFADEAKDIDNAQLQEETLPTMRANRSRFGHLSCHGSIWMTTSMPTMADAKWILKKDEEVDDERVMLIKHIMAEVYKLEAEGRTAHKTRQAVIAKRIRFLCNSAENVRMSSMNEKGILDVPSLTFYKEADSFSNIHILGQEYFANMRETMTDFAYKTEILNIRPDVTENCFYPALSIEKHTYIPEYNESYLGQFGYDYKSAASQANDCRSDSDLTPSLPLRIAVDFGGRFNCLSVTQLQNNVLSFINNLFVKHPYRLEDLATKFCDYYQHFGLKEVEVYPDHTGFNQLPNDNYTYAVQFCNVLNRRGWRVKLAERRAAPLHGEKFLLNNRVLSEDFPNSPIVRFNRVNCKELLNSMFLAPLDTDNKGIKKNKNSETNPNVEYEDATHLSDTFDILIESLFTNLIHELPAYSGSSFD